MGSIVKNVSLDSPDKNSTELKRYQESIKHCEHLFLAWLQGKLASNGVKAYEFKDLTVALKEYEKFFKGDQQHIKPLMHWNENRLRCDNFLPIHTENHSMEFLYLLEKTAFDGQVLLLTFK
ncbi:MAG: hypothetical protein ACFCUU_13535 [Cyclobacteriaceae bacterium]